MNIFVLDLNPEQAARDLDCVRLPKMCVESAQMMASALRRHGATDEQMPLTKAGKPYRGGCKHHPCTVWAGDTLGNFIWLAAHGIAQCKEYRSRFNKQHACEEPIVAMAKLFHVVPVGARTPFAQAMPDEYKHDDPVVAYRRYYQSKTNSPGGVHYRHTTPPAWWEVSA